MEGVLLDLFRNKLKFLLINAINAHHLAKYLHFLLILPPKPIKLYKTKTN